jgi:aryl-alcohol dehydrogenase-like predicted oxidoreductase
MGYAAPVTLQPHYNLIVRDIEFEVVPACQDAGVGLLPWSPLGGGWLTGKYKRDTAPTGATRLGENPNRGQESYGPRNESERVWQIIETVEAIAKARGVSMAEVALRWVADRPAVTAVILGARTVKQLEENMKADALKLSAEETAKLNAASAPVMGDYPYGKGGTGQRTRPMAGGRA